MHTEKSSRMVLVPLATMLVAGAVAVVERPLARPASESRSPRGEADCGDVSAWAPTGRLVGSSLAPGTPICSGERAMLGTR